MWGIRKDDYQNYMQEMALKEEQKMVRRKEDYQKYMNEMERTRKIIRNT